MFTVTFVPTVRAPLAVHGAPAPCTTGCALPSDTVLSAGIPPSVDGACFVASGPIAPSLETAASPDGTTASPPSGSSTGVDGAPGGGVPASAGPGTTFDVLQPGAAIATATVTAASLE